VRIRLALVTTLWRMERNLDGIDNGMEVAYVLGTFVTTGISRKIEDRDDD